MDQQMSDNQRRFYCRLLFLFFCWLPTAIIVYRACHPTTPKMWQLRIQSELGVATRVGDVETLGPKSTVLRDVTMVDGSGQPVLEALEVELNGDRTNQQITVGSQIRITNQALHYLADSLNSRLQLQSQWSIKLEDVVLVSDSGHYELPLDNVSIGIQPTSEGSRAIIKTVVRNPEQPSDMREVRCEIHRAAAPLNTQVTLDTDGTQLPCWLVSHWLPQLDHLGDEASFDGQFSLVQQADQLHGWVGGKFHDVSLPTPQPSDAATPVRQQLAIIELPSEGIRLPQTHDSIDSQMAGSPTLVLPSGIREPLVLDYQFRRVLNVESAIQKTYRAAQSKAASNHF